MKVKDLIECLRREDPEAVVVMARDSEENDFSPLRGTWVGKYVSKSSGRGVAYDPPEEGLFEEDIDRYKHDMDLDDAEFATMMAAPTCVVVYPISQLDYT